MSMKKVGIREIRQNLTAYLNKVQRGEEVVITKREEPIAKLVPVQKVKTRSLASHKDLRDRIVVKGKPLSQVIIEGREERF